MINDTELPELSSGLLLVYGRGDPLHRFYPVAKRIADGRRHIIFPDTLAAWLENPSEIASLAPIDYAAKDSAIAAQHRL